MRERPRRSVVAVADALLLFVRGSVPAAAETAAVGRREFATNPRKHKPSFFERNDACVFGVYATPNRSPGIFAYQTTNLLCNKFR